MKALNPKVYNLEQRCAWHCPLRDGEVHLRGIRACGTKQYITTSNCQLLVVYTWYMLLLEHLDLQNMKQGFKRSLSRRL